MASSHRDCIWLRTQPIAHRGLHQLERSIPENSLSAFQAAIDRNYAIELDLHLSADNEVVVFHDDTLERTTGIAGELCNKSAKALGELRLFGTDQRIPLLSDVLALVDGRSPLLIELKTSRPVGELEAEVVRLLSRYHGPFAIQSFDPYRLAWLRQNAPHVCRGQLSGKLKESDLPPYKRLILRNLLLTPWTRPHFIAYEIGALPHWNAQLHRTAGLPLLAWTVRTKHDRRRARRWATNIIFEGDGAAS
jgi:glycerophosphoryl diester phosphodiesterase